MAAPANRFVEGGCFSAPYSPAAARSNHRIGASVAMPVSFAIMGIEQMFALPPLGGSGRLNRLKPALRTSRFGSVAPLAQV